MFEKLPNKIERDNKQEHKDVWPEYGNAFELNIFYRSYEGSNGDLGESYISFWSTEEIREYEIISKDFLSEEYKIFAGDGGGTFFGFKKDNGIILYFSCDPIDLEGSMNWLGGWKEFIECIEQMEY